MEVQVNCVISHLALRDQTHLLVRDFPSANAFTLCSAGLGRGGLLL